ncbi:MAG TPA: hypothetical protein VIM84_01335, partial [Gemmatimonadales bacterium]
MSSTESLAIAEHRILDASTEACVRLPAAGAGVTEHLYIPLATAGQETPDGVSAPYVLSSEPA